ncbi:NUDIX hydrolase [Rosistilla oblonga]|uniref:Bifunctional NMN adenylyltransferase/Nudix hydrolase n=1 Tax=Rosistilla oblonga TaxID=2527990 RepID=A0A518IR31_9BACT|nr:NUDIX domain-containing protein [Rosistilla oblonga]QDV55557.1 Bifunctional NMN adenylyltransferase/Nudix hydrolase [Rosistilla oblonga]
MNLPIPQTFHFCPRCGAAATAIGKDPFQCSACQYTYHFGPTVAVGGIVTDAQGRVLLLRRARDPGKGKWGLPGGFVDSGETGEMALIREIQEEVRLNVESFQYLTSYTNSYEYRGLIIPVVDLFYTCQIVDLAALEAEPSEVQSTSFCDLGPEHLENMAFESNRLALQTFLESRA